MEGPPPWYGRQAEGSQALFQSGGLREKIDSSLSLKSPGSRKKALVSSES